MMKTKVISGVTTIALRSETSRFPVGATVQRTDIDPGLFDSLVERNKIVQPARDPSPLVPKAKTKR